MPRLPAGAGWVATAEGAQAASKALPLRMPAALRKSRRRRYNDSGVISEGSTGTER